MSRSQAKKACDNWVRSGSCLRGDSCWFSHPPRVEGGWGKRPATGYDANHAKRLRGGERENDVGKIEQQWDTVQASMRSMLR